MAYTGQELESTWNRWADIKSATNRLARWPFVTITISKKGNSVISRYKQAQKELRDQEIRNRETKLQAELMSRFIESPDRNVIITGEALNFAFDRLGQSVEAKEVPLSSQITREELEKVQLQTRGGLGYDPHQVIADNGAVVWPLYFLAGQFDNSRQMIEKDIQGLMASLNYGVPADPMKVASVDRKLGEFFAAARESVATHFVDWAEIHRFEKQFRNHIRLLATNEALHWHDGGLNCRAGSLADLLDHMYRNDLRFAPTNEAGLRLYVRLHRTLTGFKEARGKVEQVQVALSN